MYKKQIPGVAFLNMKYQYEHSMTRFKAQEDLVFYTIKQDIHVHVPCSRPNGWPEWTLMSHVMTSLRVT